MQTTTMPPGLIGLACGETARYSSFLPAIIGLQKPAGTEFMYATGLGPANPFNAIARYFLDRPEFQWLFLTNDDNLCPPDTITRLWNRNVDVVSGLYFGRMMPFEPILFDRIEMVATPTGPRRWYYRHLMQPGEQGLVSAMAVGDGCLLIRRPVMQAMFDRDGIWWEYGETLSDACDHDVVFSRKVRELGFGLYCDLDVCIDHIANVIIRPYREPGTGEWKTRLVQGDNRHIELPAAFKGMEEGPK